ncbi:hypothetical protein [Nocardia asteroides]|uniref:hypothetical protein n=1 Tax=Nocardia asteroides TaxID=1824 RepID=UPI001E3EFC84|nr:hypothetical protein [Nocardia asteroides]UGT62299.1 hypothetical protein LTT61_02835 [Nocardia asteroides]
MSAPGPSYEEALHAAREIARDPGTVVHYPHPGLENARYGRGFSFRHRVDTDRGVVDGYILVSTGGRASGILPSDDSIDERIAEHLARAEHHNRDIPDSDLTPAQHLALEAYDAGRTRIESATADADYAEYLLITLRRNPDTGEPGRTVLARNDFLLRPPEPGRRYTQPCPRCTRPALYNERYPRLVCDHCRARTTDSAGRRITGFNTSMGGGMIAYYTDTLDRPGQEECVEVTRTGRCLVDGQAAIMEEARFGGIVIRLAGSDPH